ncbi:MAG: virulence RhuM family protein [Ignavibacteria bacterium]|nr:virulence RhuM family protein [Ignavibacteria bacterium]
MNTSEQSVPQSELILYQTEDGQTRIQCRFEADTLWLSQSQMAELFQVTVPTINEHLTSMYSDGEQSKDRTVRKFRIVRSEGTRQVSREIEHYHLDAILAVGFRVRSHRGMQFRQWATARLSEYLVKGFTMDDERLKNPPGPGQVDYFDELLERIRDIRSSERRFYQKVLDIYATSVDYSPDNEASQQFFATVQNKMHWAAHGHTAAEIVRCLFAGLVLHEIISSTRKTVQRRCS